MILFNKNNISALCVVVFFGASCGIGTGGNPFNDPIPSDGIEVANGTLVGENGHTVSGTVRVYSRPGNAYVIRLEDLSISSFNNTYRLVASGSGGATPVTFSVAMRGGIGNQNYNRDSTGVVVTWTSVKIQDPSRVAGLNDVANSTLQPSTR